MNKLYLLLALGLTSCQLGPFHYTLPEKTAHEGYHGAHGNAYQASKEACLLARDLTDEELMEGADSLPGNGYRDSVWSSENPDLIETAKDDGAAYNNGVVSALCPDEIAIQHVFEGENNELFILEDDGTITEIAKLHFFEGENGKKYIFDDETGDMQEFIFDEVESAKLS